MKEVKKRPALVILSINGEDVILSEITTKMRDFPGDIILSEHDFDKGKLKLKSVVRLTRLLTVHNSLISYKIGNLKPKKTKEVIDAFLDLFRNNQKHKPLNSLNL